MLLRVLLVALLVLSFALPGMSPVQAQSTTQLRLNFDGADYLLWSFLGGPYVVNPQYHDPVNAWLYTPPRTGTCDVAGTARVGVRLTLLPGWEIHEVRAYTYANHSGGLMNTSAGLLFVNQGVADPALLYGHPSTAPNNWYVRYYHKSTWGGSPKTGYDELWYWYGACWSTNLVSRLGWLEIYISHAPDTPTPAPSPTSSATPTETPTPAPTYRVAGWVRPTVLPLCSSFDTPVPVASRLPGSEGFVVPTLAVPTRVPWDLGGRGVYGAVVPPDPGVVTPATWTPSPSPTPLCVDEVLPSLPVVDIGVIESRAGPCYRLFPDVNIHTPEINFIVQIPSVAIQVPSVDVCLTYHAFGLEVLGIDVWAVLQVFIGLAMVRLMLVPFFREG